VATWYEDRGYEVIDRNWRCSLGEIDLVCRKGEVLVVCEVKSRRSDAFGAPIEAVTMAKWRRLRRLAARWLADHGARCSEVRFDVASVFDGHVDLVEGAF